MHKGKMYACFAFFPNGDVKRWKYVRDLFSFSQFLNKSHSGWKYFNVYDKGTKQYLKRFYPGNIVPRVLPFLVLLLAGTLTHKFTFNETTFSKTTFINGFNNSATIPMISRKEGGGLC